MELRITQCHLGHYNLLDSKQESLAFGMAIYHNGQIVVENGVKAIVAYNGDPEDLDTFKDALNNLDWMFEKCYEDGNKWIGNGKNNRESAGIFAKLYRQYFSDINTAHRSKEEDRIRKKIAELEKELKCLDDLPESIADTFNGCVTKEINQYAKWQAGKRKELEDTKYNTDKFNSLTKEIADYQLKIDKLDALIIQEPINFVDGLE